VLAALLLALGAAAAPAPHANSISVSELEVTESVLRHELELQTLSILEVLPELDADGDGLLSEDELERSSAPLGAYLDANFALFIGEPPSGPLETKIVGLRESASGEPESPFAMQRIAVTRELELAALPPTVTIEVSVFAETSPDHRDFCTLRYPGQFEEEWLFSAERPLWKYEPDPDLGADIFEAFFKQGAARLLAFEVSVLLLLLLFACPRASDGRQVLAVYALGLAAGAALTSLRGELLPIRVLDLTLILAVSYTGLENALQREPRLPRIEAVLFGLVLGIALVQELTGLVVDLPRGSTALGGFGLGAAASFLVFGSLALLLLPRLGGTRLSAAALAPDWLRRRGSAVLALIALVLFVQRAWFANA